MESQHQTQPDSAQAGQCEASNREDRIRAYPEEDLIITQDHLFAYVHSNPYVSNHPSFAPYSFVSNRWRFASSELVDYERITDWKDNLMTTPFTHLKRIKIRDLPPDVRMFDFLIQLSRTTEYLNYLEFDRIQLTRQNDQELLFKYLEVLAIGWIDLGDQVNADQKLVFKVRDLKWVSMGGSVYPNGFTSSLDFVQFNFFDHDPRIDKPATNKILHLETERLTSEAQVRSFPELTHLMCHCLMETELGLIVRLLTDASLAPKLRMFNVYLRRYGRVDDSPTTTELFRFAQLYGRLFYKGSNRVRVGLMVRVNGVPLSPKTGPDLYHFRASILECHHSNFKRNVLNLLPCSTVYKIENFALQYRYNLTTNDHRMLSASMFDGIYPNLRVIELNGRQTTAAKFLYFLEFCEGLNKLQLINSGFGAEFYHNFVQIPSTRTLAVLIFQETTEYRDGRFQALQFSFLSQLPYLHYLKTNMGTRTWLVLSMLTMRVDAKYDFLFSPRDPGATRPNTCTVRRTSAIQFSINFNSNNYFDQIKLGPELFYYFDVTVRGLTSHWLDPIERF